MICGLVSATLADSEVSLRPFARVEPGRAVTLADVAELTGPDALSLRDTVIVTAASLADAPDTSITLESVREALRSLPGVNAGKLLFSGSSCSVRASAPRVARPESVPKVTSSSRRPVPAADGDSVRRSVTQRIAESLGVQDGDLRLTFEERQADLLNTATAGKTVAIQCTGSGERMTYGVRIYEQDRLVQQSSLRIGVLVRRSVAVARNTINRGDVIAQDDFTLDEQWLAPCVVPAEASGIPGRVAKATINPGELISEREVEANLAVRKGDLVSVDCLSGSVVVRTTAKALADGKVGEIIGLETLQWKKQISGRVSSTGHAVCVSQAAVPSQRSRRAATPDQGTRPQAGAARRAAEIDTRGVQ